jgi:hypothetical protein
MGRADLEVRMIYAPTAANYRITSTAECADMMNTALVVAAWYRAPCDGEDSSLSL